MRAPLIRLGCFLSLVIPPSASSDSAGKNFVVVWESFGSAVTDTSRSSIQGQRFLPEPAFVPSLGVMIAARVALARRQQTPSAPAS